MVDLVKVRRKAKEKAAQKAEGRGQRAEGKGEGEKAEGRGQKAEGQRAEGEKAEGRGQRAEGEKVEGRGQRAEGLGAEDKIARFLETAGQRRESGKKTVDEPAKEQIELLAFEIAGEQYAIDIEHLVEIVTPRPVTRVPNADPSIAGILSLRGMIVTLIDVRARLHHPPGEPKGEDVRVIVTDSGGESAGFVVDRVLRVIKVDAGSIDPHPVVHTSENDESVRGVFRNAGALTMLLDLEKLLGRVVRNGTYV